MSSSHRDGGYLWELHDRTRGQDTAEAPALHLCHHGDTGIWACSHHRDRLW